SGVSHDHPALAQNMWKNSGEGGGAAANGVDDDGNGFVDDDQGWDFVSGDRDPFDDQGHGTLVAGVVAAAGNNGNGLTGVAWHAPIIPLKILDVNGVGRVSWAVEALNYAAGLGVKLTNHSYGLIAEANDVPVLQEAVDAAGQAGMLIVTAAGNNGRNTDLQPFLPASLDGPHILAVGASDRSDRKWSKSNYGVDSVDLLAPGVDVAMTASLGDCSLCAPTGIRHGSGTSAATPHVTAVAGLAWSCFPDLSPGEIRDLVMNRAEPIAETGLTASDGRLNAANVLAPTRLLSDDFEEGTAGWTRGSSTSLAGWARVETADGNGFEKVVGPTPISYEAPRGGAVTLSRQIRLGPEPFVPGELRVDYREMGSLNPGDEVITEACVTGCEDAAGWVVVREVRCDASAGVTCPLGAGDRFGDVGGVVDLRSGAATLRIRFRLEDRPLPAGIPGAGTGWAIDDVRVEGSLPWISVGEPPLCPMQVR
ncbi:MAG: S8 family peptidase, partial [Candidatus Binatia bacterium]